MHVCGFEGCVKPSKYAALLMCSGCRVVRYCDVGCQKAAWRGHKAACRAAAAELSRTQLVPVGTVRAVSEDDLHADVTQLRVMAAQGNADAEYVLGERYATGNGVPQDDKAAAEWYLKAARQGHAHAQYSIGCCYNEGRGVAQDNKAAFQWFLKAARQGHAGAQTNTGVSYDQGTGVEQDHDQAMAWYLKAAQQGHAQAQYNAARYFRRAWAASRSTTRPRSTCTSRRAIKAWRRRSATVHFYNSQEPRRTSSRLSSGTRRLRAKGTRPRSSMVPAGDVCFMSAATRASNPFGHPSSHAAIAGALAAQAAAHGGGGFLVLAAITAARPRSRAWRAACGARARRRGRGGRPAVGARGPCSFSAKK